MLESHYLPVSEDHLPEGQEPVQTRSLTQLATQARLLMNTRRQTGYSMIGITTGRPGAGKTVAIQDFLQKQQMQPHTGLPACIEIRMKPDSTPKAFVEDLLLRLEDQHRPRLENTRYKLSDRAAELIVSHDIQLIIADEVEQLTVSGFEFLRYLFGKTGCPLLLVGPGVHASHVGTP
jgi:DNA transposition AAA+ family ATPase